MRIRTQLLSVVGASLAAVVATAALMLAAERRESAAAQAQSLAQTTAHEVTGLLTLTQEYVRYGEPRAAEQWRSRQRAIEATLRDEGPPVTGSLALGELRAAAASLPPLFARLEEIGVARNAFAERRQAALVDQLLTTTQAMSDFAYQWAQDAAEARATVARRFRLIAVVAPLLMLAVLAGVAWVVQRRVLRPLAELERAAAAVREGRLDGRLASTAPDEFGELSRQFDAMTAALADGRDRLQRSERQLRDIADHLPVLVGYADAGEVYRFTNANYRRIDGKDPQSYIGKTIAEMIPHEIYAELREHIQAALRGEHRSFEVHRPVSREGERWLHFDYLPDTDDAGKVAGFYIMTADITDRHRAEIERTASEQRLLDLMNSIPAMVGWFDMDERCRYANDSGLKSLGLARADLPGLTLRAALGEANYAQHEPYVREVLQGRRARLNGKTAFKNRSAHFQAHLIPDRVEGGAQRGFYLMTFDITALQEAQMRQAHMEARLRAISDNLPVLIAYVDTEERYVFLNRTYKDWFGVEHDAMLGRTVAEALGPAQYALRKEALQRALAGERVEFELQTEVLGVVRNLQTVYIPDIESDGRVVGAYALSSDVSSQKAVEQELARLARCDRLTGLPNRLLFEELMPMALARARRSGRALALMFLDIDHFKQINDTHGHAGGDAVLCELAVRLRQSVRVTDTAARLAGDEFVVALEGLHHPDEPQSVARNILAQVRRPFFIGAQKLAVTVSIGIAYHDPADGNTSTERLLARSDAALYAAKQAGRNGFHLAPQSAESSAA